jgi:hypothetical protein
MNMNANWRPSDASRGLESIVRTRVRKYTFSSQKIHANTLLYIVVFEHVMNITFQGPEANITLRHTRKSRFAHLE